jgi:methionyl-tRNA formyltransferase
MRVIFMGSPDFAVTALKALHEAGHEIICVYSQPPRPKGRGQHLEKTPVHAAAEAMGLMVRTPATFKDEQAVADFQSLNADIAVVAAYGLILRKPILNGTKRGCINIHASLLPRWRGAAPIHRAIEAGDIETGITIMQMDIGLDTGPMLLTGKTPITHDDTTDSVHDRLAVMGGELIVETLDRIDDLQPVTQPEEGITYAQKIVKEEAHIDWTMPAGRILHKLKAFTPAPGLWINYKGERLRIHHAHVVPSEGEAGAIIASPFVIACGESSLSVETIQRAGKTAQPIAEFVRGFAVTVGDKVA